MAIRIENLFVIVRASSIALHPIFLGWRFFLFFYLSLVWAVAAAAARSVLITSIYKNFYP